MSIKSLNVISVILRKYFVIVDNTPFSYLSVNDFKTMNHVK